MSTAVSPLAPTDVPDMPEIAGVRLATAAAGIRYKGRTDVLCRDGQCRRRLSHSTTGGYGSRLKAGTTGRDVDGHGLSRRADEVIQSASLAS